MYKMIGTSSYLPDTTVRLVPEFAGGVNKAFQKSPVSTSYIYSYVNVIMCSLKYLAKNIQLKLPIGTVADAYWP
ncbi:hypothetical protein ES703_118299 [subsurface metagenome]